MVVFKSIRFVTLGVAGGLSSSCSLSPDQNPNPLLLYSLCVRLILIETTYHALVFFYRKPVLSSLFNGHVSPLGWAASVIFELLCSKLYCLLLGKEKWVTPPSVTQHHWAFDQFWRGRWSCRSEAKLIDCYFISTHARWEPPQLVLTVYIPQMFCFLTLLGSNTNFKELDLI